MLLGNGGIRLLSATIKTLSEILLGSSYRVNHCLQLKDALAEILILPVGIAKSHLIAHTK